jgi:DNA damage-inducible protein 1
MTLNDIKAIIQAETNVSPSSQYFLQDGRPVSDTSVTLSQMNVQEGDVVGMMIQNARPRRTPAQPNTTDASIQRARTGVDPEQSRLRILGDPVILAELRRQDPELAAATSDQERFLNLWTTRQKQYEQVQRDKEEQVALLEADPFNVEAQQKIEEMIRQARVAENLQKAMEENPECKLLWAAAPRRCHGIC